MAPRTSAEGLDAGRRSFDSMYSGPEAEARTDATVPAAAPLGGSASAAASARALVLDRVPDGVRAVDGLNVAKGADSRAPSPVPTLLAAADVVAAACSLSRRRCVAADSVGGREVCETMETAMPADAAPQVGVGAAVSRSLPPPVRGDDPKAVADDSQSPLASPSGTPNSESRRAMAGSEGAPALLSSRAPFAGRRGRSSADSTMDRGAAADEAPTAAGC
jgi:hypothetical protein